MAINVEPQNVYKWAELLENGCRYEDAVDKQSKMYFEFSERVNSRAW